MVFADGPKKELDVVIYKANIITYVHTFGADIEDVETTSDHIIIKLKNGDWVRINNKNEFTKRLMIDKLKGEKE